MKVFYKTVFDKNIIEIPKIKWSKFIWLIFNINSKDDVKNYLDFVKKKYINATHYCYAYRFWVKIKTDLFGNISLYSDNVFATDDWEPSWTALYPMKRTIEKYELFNVLLVIVRFFWWTKLWIWWLIQAYTNVSEEVIKASKIIKKDIFREIFVEYWYDDISFVNWLIKKYDVKIVEHNFDKKIYLNGQINVWFFEEFLKNFGENVY